jgi:hypothetical protein
MLVLAFPVTPFFRLFGILNTSLNVPSSLFLLHKIQVHLFTDALPGIPAPLDARSDIIEDNKPASAAGNFQII